MFFSRSTVQDVRHLLAGLLEIEERLAKAEGHLSKAQEQLTKANTILIARELASQVQNKVFRKYVRHPKAGEMFTPVEARFARLEDIKADKRVAKADLDEFLAKHPTLKRSLKLLKDGGVPTAHPQQIEDNGSMRPVTKEDVMAAITELYGGTETGHFEICCSLVEVCNALSTDLNEDFFVNTIPDKSPTMLANMTFQ